MKELIREYLPGLLNVLTGLTVLLASFLVDSPFPMPREIAKPSGALIVLTGMSLVVWATMHIKEAILGEVEPRLDVLVKDGPYRFVRHPVYLGMTIALLGVTVGSCVVVSVN